MADELRHTRVITMLAARFGSAPRDVEVPELPGRPLAEIAHENAVEGCVHEAYGALIATYQADCASPEVGAAFQEIASDERAHVQLAEDVQAWLMERLDLATRARVDATRSKAQAALRTRLITTSACPQLGVPDDLHAVALFDAYFAA